MNFRKWSLSVLIFFCGATFFNLANALTLKSYSVSRANIAVMKNDDPNVFQVRVWADNMAQAQKVLLQIIDKNGAAVFEQENPAKFSERKPTQLDVDFAVDLTKNKLAGDYKLKAGIFNEDGQKIAWAELPRNFAGNSVSSEISDLKIKADKDLVKGSVQFKNNGEAGDFVAKIDVYKDNNQKEYVGTYSSEIISVGAGEELGIPFTFAKPAAPQLYNVKVGIVQNNQAVTGKLAGSFLVEGDFGEFYSLAISPQKYFKKGDTATIEFTGSTTTDKETPLSVEINVKNEAGMALQKIINVMPEDALGNFAGKEMFLVTEGSKKLFVEAILWQGNNELGRISKATKEFAKPKEIGFINKIKELKSRENLSTADKYKIIAVLIVIVLAIIIFIRGLVRANKGKNFFIFFCLILASGTAFANVKIYYPQPDEIYSNHSNSDPKLQFNEIGFMGRITSNQGGLLPNDGKVVNYEVTIGGDENGVGGDTAGTGSFTMTDGGNEIYKFSFKIPDGFTQGKWNVHVRFYGTDVNARLDDLGIGTSGVDDDIEFNGVGSGNKIIIDGAAPNVDFGFSGDNYNSLTKFANNTFRMKPKCDDNLAKCYRNFASFPVTGNFCDPAENSDHKAICKDSSGTAVRVHKFKICDRAGNCNTRSAGINFFDPVKPTMGNLVFKLPDGRKIVLGNNNVSAEYTNNLILKNVEDPATGTLSDPNIVLDDYVCNNSNEFSLDDSNKVCVENFINCATGPWSHGYCTWDDINNVYVGPVVNCPNGTTYNSTTNECDPSCYHDRFPYCFAVEPE